MADRKRLNLELTQRTYGKLESVQKRSNAASRTEAITRALELYQKVLDNEDAGGDLIFETDQERLKVVIV